jgi:hypothetical protein
MGGSLIMRRGNYKFLITFLPEYIRRRKIFGGGGVSRRVIIKWL